ncbi:MAG TPA: hypothetical protein VGM98_04340 [Schlesneria sp.]
MITPNGNVKVTVFLKDGRYGVCFNAMLKRKMKQARFFPYRVGSQAEAKLMAFESIDAMRHAVEDSPKRPDETA